MAAWDAPRIFCVDNSGNHDDLRQDHRAADIVDLGLFSNIHVGRQMQEGVFGIGGFALSSSVIMSTKSM